MHFRGVLKTLKYLYTVILELMTVSFIISYDYMYTLIVTSFSALLLFEKSQTGCYGSVQYEAV